jgi:transposase
MVLIPSHLEEVLPADHPVRMVDELLERLDWSDWEAQYNGRRGQPPIHPAVLAKVLVFSLLRRIRSSRQIEYTLKHSIDFMWLASGRQIDHVTLCNFRRQHSEQLRGIFRQLVKLAIDLGVANLSELCIDGTRVLASANKYKTWTADKIEKLLSELDSQLLEALSSLEAADTTNEDLLGDDYSADKLPPSLADMKARRDKLTEHLESLREMDAARAKYGKDPKTNPAQLPKTDPDSRILPNKEGGYAANYTPMVTTDSTGGFIISTDVMIGNVEHDQLTVSIDSIGADFSVDIERVLADSAYTTGENLTAAEERGVELIGPLAEVKCKDNPSHRDDLTQPVAEEDIDKLPRNPTTKCFDKSAFVYNAEEDCYHCPAGKPLEYRCTENVHRGDKKVARRVYTSKACSGCPLASLCRKNPDAKKGREVAHDCHEDARRRHRERMETDEGKAAYARRCHPGETPFTAIKSAFDMRRFLLRGIEGVGQEWLWSSTAFNIKTFIGMWEVLRSKLQVEVK